MSVKSTNQHIEVPKEVVNLEYQPNCCTEVAVGEGVSIATAIAMTCSIVSLHTVKRAFRPESAAKATTGSVEADTVAAIVAVDLEPDCLMSREKEGL